MADRNAMYGRPPTGNAMAAYGPQTGNGMLGYQVRTSLYPGEDNYFRSNPHVAGMAAETNDVILNPYSPQGVDHDAVARNEALRLYMKEHGIAPSFDVTEDQRAAFRGTAYENNDPALRETIAARIYSMDPSAQATPEQRAWVRSQMFPGPRR